MLSSRLKILPADKSFKKIITKDENKPSGKLEIETYPGHWIKVDWYYFRSWAGNRRVNGKPYTGTVYSLGTKEKFRDANPDLINMYKQKFEEAIDNGDKEEMKRWFREIMNNVNFNDAEPQTVGKHNDVPDDQYDVDELVKGIKVEMEHTDDEAIAKAIAKDHLSEKNSRKYYSYLLLLEKLMQNNVSLESIQGLLK